ncbi:hypothetical protein ACIA47_16055 [Micromonospora sp. NPDC051227]|uniref:hypothetical protein n=1 Tax=Micromonospora sp. NPDC051227 TaxID=3364285 RepID=UPI0037AE67A9
MSLLIGELVCGLGSERDDLAGFVEDLQVRPVDDVTVTLLTNSLAAALLATVILRLRNRTYRRIHDAETVDADRDNIPDVCEQPAGSRTDTA